MNAYIIPCWPSATQQTSCYVLLTPHLTSPHLSPPTAAGHHHHHHHHTADLSNPRPDCTVMSASASRVFNLNKDPKLPLGDLLATCLAVVDYPNTATDLPHQSSQILRARQSANYNVPSAV